MLEATSPKVEAHRDLESFFHGAVEQATSEQRVSASDDTKRYLGALLAHFSRADRLLEQGPDGPQFAPLAHYYGVSQTAPTAAERSYALKRLGDIALFISGLFQASLARKAVDVDYYVAMGGAAYGTLAERPAALGSAAHAHTFAELAQNFIEFVDVLATVGEETTAVSDRDLLRLYELWQRTGSGRAERTLRKAGIMPLHPAGGVHRH